MIRKDLSYVNRILGLLLVILLSHSTIGQMKPDKNPLESFLDTQFWLGLKMGVNYTQAYPETRFAGFSPVNYNSDTLQKSYNDFTLPGAHMGLEMNFYHRGFSISFQPVYKRSRYSYQSSVSWLSESSGNRFESSYEVEQRLDLIELPIMIKYDVIRSGKIRPFVMIGGFHSTIASAQKEVDIRLTDYANGTPLNSSGGTTTLASKDGFKNFSGLAGGIGMNLDFWNIRTVFEINYKRSLTPVTRGNVRENELASFGELNDEILLRDISASLSFVFPFRYIDQQFKAY